MRRTKTYLSDRVRVGVFVDVQNMFYSAREYYGGKLDFEKFLAYAVRGRDLVLAVAYLVQAEDVDQSAFISVLEHMGFKVRVKPLKRRSDGTARSDWDIGIAVDTLTWAEKLDVVILATGDGDFAELVKALKARGVMVELVSFAQNTAEALKQAADRFYPITEHLIIKKTLKPPVEQLEPVAEEASVDGEEGQPEGSAEEEKEVEEQHL